MVFNIESLHSQVFYIMNKSQITELLSLLEGTWNGSGLGFFPTIDSFEYREEMKFIRDEERLLLHYEQRTWVQESAIQRRRPSHWESGFLVFDDNLNGSINCAQSGGRLELIALNKLDFNGPIISLDFSPSRIVNDSRMLGSNRSWRIETSKKLLSYEMNMATTKVKDIQAHLKAELRKD